MRYLLVLAIGQNVGWGTIGLLTVLGADIAAGLDMSLPSAFMGSTVFYVTMGLVAPVMGAAFVRLGARRLLVAGSLGLALGFAALGASQDIVTYLAAWLVLGLSGATSLSTAAHIALNEALGAKAGRAIGALMIASGLSGTIFWPITAYLSQGMDWRLVCALYAALLVATAVLYLGGLPMRPNAEPGTNKGVEAPPPVELGGTFYIVAAAISLNAFVTFGFSGIIIELLKSYGLPLATATTLASSLGIIQISARALDFLGGQRWDGLNTALVAGPTLLASLLLLLVMPEPSLVAIIGFIVIYGFGAGALAVSRATMPLVFYDRADYARALSRIALPLNLLSAAAPPILVALLEGIGPSLMLLVASTCSAAALGLLVMLHLRRPAQRR
ncbi:MFS transporter [Devosia sp. MSA67]|uniref:MFS transporter n=1 Tax=Devosia sediminis TaxID=2798801 RepID=A0A934ITZ3_9HYPH|nr:MFS transporter [Devosia sediminis]